jgi:hypothetical protein
MLGGKRVSIVLTRTVGPKPSLRHRLRHALVNNVSRCTPLGMATGACSSRKVAPRTQEGRHLGVTVLVPFQQDVRYFPVVQSECVSFGCGCFPSVVRRCVFSDIEPPLFFLVFSRPYLKGSTRGGGSNYDHDKVRETVGRTLHTLVETDLLSTRCPGEQHIRDRELADRQPEE